MSAERFDKMAAKIGKLLAKAERTDNPHEAEAFTAQAERLMVRFGIEEATARAASGSTVAPESIITIPLAFEGRYGFAMIEGSFFIVRSLGLRAYRRGEHLFYIVGHESDAKAAAFLIQSLWLQAVPAMWSWWKSEGKHQWFYNGYEEMKARKSFIASFGAAVSVRVKKTRAEESAAVPGSALVLVDREKEVEEFMNQMTLKTSRAKGFEGSHAGYAAGMKANLNETAIGGTAAIGGDR